MHDARGGCGDGDGSSAGGEEWKHGSSREEEGEGKAQPLKAAIKSPEVVVIALRL